jgi:hypothetical protein
VLHPLLVRNLRPLKPRRLFCGDVGELPVACGRRETEPDVARSRLLPWLPWCECEVPPKPLPWLLVIEDDHFRFEVELSDLRLRMGVGPAAVPTLIGVKPRTVAACPTDHRHDDPLTVLSGECE